MVLEGKSGKSSGFIIWEYFTVVLCQSALLMISYFKEEMKTLIFSCCWRKNLGNMNVTWKWVL